MKTVQRIFEDYSADDTAAMSRFMGHEMMFEMKIQGERNR